MCFAAAAAPAIGGLTAGSTAAMSASMVGVQAASVTAQATAAAAAQAATMTQIMQAISVAQTVAGFVGQQQQAAAMAEYQQQMYDQNKEIADESAKNQYQGLSTRTYQEREAMALDIRNASRAAHEAMGTARVSSGEAGVSGISTEALLQDFERRQYEYVYGRERSQQFREQDFESKKKAIAGQQQGRILAMTPKPVEEPSYIGAALRIGSGYFDAKRKFSIPVWDGQKFNYQSY